jgi:hypothetical protein
MRAAMGSFGRFVRLWLLLLFSYALVRFLYNLGVRGYVDISTRVLDELVYIPLAQAAIFWSLTRRKNRAMSNESVNGEQ